MISVKLTDLTVQLICVVYQHRDALIYPYLLSNIPLTPFETVI